MSFFRPMPSLPNSNRAFSIPSLNRTLRQRPRPNLSVFSPLSTAKINSRPNPAHSTSSPSSQSSAASRHPRPPTQAGIPTSSRSIRRPSLSTISASGATNPVVTKSAIRHETPPSDARLPSTGPVADSQLGPSNRWPNEGRINETGSTASRVGSDRRKTHHRWAWEWFQEGQSLEQIGIVLARLAGKPNENAQPIAPRIISSWILKHLSRPFAGPVHAQPSSPSLDPSSFEKPDLNFFSEESILPEEEKVCPPSPTNAHSFHLLTPTLWERLTVGHQPQFEGKTFAETIQRSIDAKTDESKRVWDLLTARGWRGEGLLTRKDDVGGYGLELAKLRGNFDEAGVLGVDNVDVDVRVLRKVLIDGRSDSSDHVFESETKKIARLLASRASREQASRNGPRDVSQPPRHETKETWQDVVASGKRKSAQRAAQRQ